MMYDYYSMKKHKKNKLLILPFIIIGILCLLTVGVLGFKLKQDAMITMNYSTTKWKTNTAPEQTANTSDWKTYTNTKYGFEFKYPNNWTINEKAISDPNPETGIEKTATEISFSGDGKYSSISINPEGGRDLNVNPTMTRSETHIGGIKAFEYSFSPDTGFKFYGYFDSKKYPEFSITTHDATKKDSESIQQLLSSFKFIE